MNNFNVIALVDEPKMQRIIACVSQGGINVSTVTDLHEAFIKIQNEAFDIILVDSLHDKAESFCQKFYDAFSIPIILLIDGDESSWPNFCSFKVDGFLSEESSNIELVARIKAFARRKTNLRLASEIHS
jgi:DNA-binding response OmpR family regulator